MCELVLTPAWIYVYGAVTAGVIKQSDSLPLLVCPSSLLPPFQIEVERGLSFDEALDKLNQEQCPGEGFYTSKRVRIWVPCP